MAFPSSYASGSGVPAPGHASGREEEEREAYYYGTHPPPPAATPAVTELPAVAAASLAASTPRSAAPPLSSGAGVPTAAGAAAGEQQQPPPPPFAAAAARGHTPTQQQQQQQQHQQLHLQQQQPPPPMPLHLVTPQLPQLQPYQQQTGTYPQQQLTYQQQPYSRTALLQPAAAGVEALPYSSHAAATAAGGVAGSPSGVAGAAAGGGGTAAGYVGPPQQQQHMLPVVVPPIYITSANTASAASPLALPFGSASPPPPAYAAAAAGLHAQAAATAAARDYLRGSSSSSGGPGGGGGAAAAAEMVPPPPATSLHLHHRSSRRALSPSYNPFASSSSATAAGFPPGGPTAAAGAAGAPTAAAAGGGLQHTAAGGGSAAAVLLLQGGGGAGPSYGLSVSFPSQQQEEELARLGVLPRRRSTSRDGSSRLAGVATAGQGSGGGAAALLLQGIEPPAHATATSTAAGGNRRASGGRGGRREGGGPAGGSSAPSAADDPRAAAAAASSGSSQPGRDAAATAAGGGGGVQQQQQQHSVDRAFLRVPLECALRSFKTHHRKVNRDMAVVLSYLLKGKLAAQLLSDAASTEEKIKKLDVVIEKLQKIRDKAQRGSAESRAFLVRCQKRLRRLVEEPDIQELHSKECFSFAFYGRRVAWEVHEYLCRSGMLATAAVMKTKLRLEPYTDAEVYEEVLQVLAGLLRQSTEAALAWVAEHRPKLKKLGSPFESELHVQHVLGLLQQRDAKAAVAYLKANVGPDDFARCSDIRKVVTLTALLEDPPPQYARLFGADRWHRLSCLFLQTSAQVYGFSLKPTLIALLQAGFSALRSAACEEQKSASCPACFPEWREYVKRVPMPHRVQSFLICPISGELMDDKNPPLASPDGHVYSTKAVQALAAASADRRSVLCPKMQQTYPIERFSRIYVT